MAQIYILFSKWEFNISFTPDYYNQYHEEVSFSVEVFMFGKKIQTGNTASRLNFLKLVRVLLILAFSKFGRLFTQILRYLINFILKYVREVII